jgi:hypothetical protein
MHDLLEAVLGVGRPNKKSQDLRIYGWNAQHVMEDKFRYAALDAYVSFGIGEILQNKYGCNLRLSPTLVPDSSPSLEEDGEEEEEDSKEEEE